MLVVVLAVLHFAPHIITDRQDSEHLCVLVVAGQLYTEYVIESTVTVWNEAAKFHNDILKLTQHGDLAFDFVPVITRIDHDWIGTFVFQTEQEDEVEELLVLVERLKPAKYNRLRNRVIYVSLDQLVITYEFRLCHREGAVLATALPAFAIAFKGAKTCGYKHGRELVIDKILIG